ncbi:MAG: FAD-binding protein [Actinobacteria bacterium]|nr:FAD-binding protein [Actinomycetota bacterium]
MDLVDELKTICSPERVVTRRHALQTYESDGLLQYRALPRAVALVDSAEEVRRVVRACYEAGVPWVARGSGTGLSGGALPVEEGIVIALSRLRKILEVDLDNQRIVVEPGVTNVDVSAAVGPGHFYPPDPSSQIVCSIGGNIAENSGGAHCFKYGFTTNYVTGLEVVLSDGDVVTLGGKEVDRPGYDLLGAFVGSEGTLGVATKITLRVVPVPEATRTLVAYYQTTDAAGQTVSDIVSEGIVPGAIEMMDNLTIRATDEATHAGYPLDAGAALIVELDGPESECAALFEQVEAICMRNGATGIRVAKDEAERALIWKARKAAFAAMGRISRNYYVQDGVIPRTKLPEVLRRIDDLSREYGMKVANVFHAGDGNLHPLVCYDDAQPGQAEKAEEFAGLIVQACVDAGGSLTGEHGIGVDKKRYMPDMFSEADLATFQRLRCAFDAAQLANPGKVMPTPRLCGEVPGPYRQHPLERAGVAERF